MVTKSTKFHLILLVSFALSLTACGGGGDSGDSDEGDVGGDEPTIPAVPASTGVFVDSVVTGLHYETPTFSGFTNSAGEYDFLPGESVTFSIGGIVLGSAPAGPVVTPLTLVSGATNPANPAVTNIVRLLLTLDDDGNSNNGILISAAATAAAASLSVDLTTTELTKDAGVATLLAALPGTPALVDATVAQAHFTEVLATTWGSMSWGTGTWKAVVPP
jgi:hypothetical protein